MYDFILMFNGTNVTMAQIKSDISKTVQDITIADLGVFLSPCK